MCNQLDPSSRGDACVAPTTRKSPRLKGYDYAQPGAYFVTICTKDRVSLFGHLSGGAMRLNNLGEIAVECWEQIPAHFPTVPLDEFIVMPDHVHALIWFPETGQLSSFMNKWKELTSKAIKKLYREKFPNYWKLLDKEDPVWQPKYHSFNVFAVKKIEEKLDYMHLNSVRAGLVERAVDWTWSSARWYLQGKQVGLPISMPGGIL